MKMIFLLISLLWISLTYAQDTATQAKYAFVSMPHFDSGIANWAINNACKAYFSNGSIKDLNAIIGTSNKSQDFKNNSIVAQYEFKLLDYFYLQGYELIGVVQQRPSVNRQFYFRHK